MNIEKVNRVKREIHDRPEWFAPDSPALDVAVDRLIDQLVNPVTPFQEQQSCQ